MVKDTSGGTARGKSARTGARTSTARTGKGAGPAVARTSSTARGRTATTRPKSSAGRRTGNSRPGKPPARPPSAAVGGRRRSSLQVWRLAALSLVLAMLGVFLFPTVTGYVDQRREVTQLEQQIETQTEEIAALEGEVEQWSDPDFIERNARERLRFVRPGETAFTILDDTGEALTEPMPGMAQVTNDVHETHPWYGEVWESFKSANEGLPETDVDGG